MNKYAMTLCFLAMALPIFAQFNNLQVQSVQGFPHLPRSVFQANALYINRTGTTLFCTRNRFDLRETNVLLGITNTSFTPFYDSVQHPNRAANRRILKQVAIVTASTLLIVPTLLDTTSTHLVLTMGSLYGFSIVGQKYLCKASDRIPIPVWPKYLLYAYSSGMLLENFVTIDNRKLPFDERSRVQFHPERNKDLLIGLGFYAPFALGGTWLANRYNFTHTEIFIMTAVSGILIEQQGRIFLSFNPAAWLATSIPYGSFQALPALLTKNELNSKNRKQIKTGKKILLMTGVQTGAILLGTLAGQGIKQMID